MKCPKCAYVSFDYNDACPKCGNALTTERDEMNLPPFKPNPPFLLSSLVGGEDGLEGVPEAQEAGDVQPDQEELVANLDQLAQAYKEPEHPQGETIAFDAAEETPEAEEITLESETDASEGEELRFNIEPEPSESEAPQYDSTPEAHFEDTDTLEFDIDPGQSEKDAISFDDELEIPEQGQKELQSEFEAPESEAHQSEPEEIEPSDTQIEFDLDQALEDAEPPGDSVWDTEALEKKMAEVEEQASKLPEADESRDQKSNGDTEEFVIELDDIEPLEMDIETEPSDKKDPE